MKTIYFVRHGQSIANETQVRQGPEGALTDVGKQQAAAVAARFAHIPIDIIISSPYERACATADIIHTRLNVPFEKTELARERDNPSQFIGRSRYEPDVVAATQEIFDRFGEPDWRYADEETFGDLKERAHALAAYLKERSEDNVLVVSHGMFMRIFLSYVIFGDTLTADVCRPFMTDTLKVKNTAITVYQCNSENSWQLVTWNDHAHLG